MLRLFAFLLVVQIAISNGIKIQPKVIKGMVSNARDFPFFVTIKESLTGRKCSGTLISDRWIITTAHCIDPNYSHVAYLGNHQNGSFELTATVNGDGSHIHPRYYEEPDVYDIGLIELPAPIQLSENIQPIAMPQRCVDTYVAGLRVVVAGAGKAYYGQDKEDMDGKIRQATFTTFARTEYAGLTEKCYKGDLSSILLAATPGTSRLFEGDAGGPIILENDGTFLGVHYAVCDVRYKPPHAFMKLSHFFGWISEKTGLSLPDCSEQ